MTDVTRERADALADAAELPAAGLPVEGVPTEGRRTRAARGTLINSAFLIGLNLLALVKGFLVAAFIPVDDYGVWGLIIVSFMTLFGLLTLGVSDRYIQQDAADQEREFQRAFTLQLILNGASTLAIIGLLPVYALVYGNSEIIVPGWVLALSLPAGALQAPLWTFYKRMDYLRQRRLQAIDPIVGIVVTLVLAISGFGYWSLVIGSVAGAWMAAAFAVRASPYKLRLSYDRGTMKEYASFSGPLMFNGACIALTSFAPTLAAERKLGTAAVGAIAIASTISQYTNKVERVVTSTLYPVVCSVKARGELLQEAFLKSNKLGLLWASPAGLGIVLFVPDIVEFGIGTKWRDAIPVIQAFAVVAVLNQVAVSWHIFFRAVGETRPIAAAGVVMMLAVTGIAVPLMLAEGLVGYSVGMGIAVAIYTVCRLYYLRRLFPVRPMLKNTVRGLVPALAAFAGTGALRLLFWGGDRSEPQVAGEIGTFVLLTLAVTAISERALLTELLGYLRTKPGKPASQPG